MNSSTTPMRNTVLPPNSQPLAAAKPRSTSEGSRGGAGGRHGAALAGCQAGTPADARWAGRVRGTRRRAAQPRRPVARCPSPAAGQPRREERRRVCERLVDAGGRLGNAGKVLRLALHAQQALVDDLGAAPKRSANS